MAVLNQLFFLLTFLFSSLVFSSTEPLLHRAAKLGRIDRAKSLLKKGSKLNELDSTGRTAFYLAAEHEQYQFMDFLIEKKAFIFISPKQKKGILSLLREKRTNLYSEKDKKIAYVSWEIITALIKKISLIKEEFYNAMFVAAGIGLENTLVKCAKNHISPSEVDERGMSPLHCAAKLKQILCVQVLLDLGADINARNFFEKTPLYEAASKGYLKIVKLLLKNGALPENVAYLVAKGNGHFGTAALIKKKMKKIKKMKEKIV